MTNGGGCEKITAPWAIGAAGAQVPYKHKVGGSNPSSPTRIFRPGACRLAFFAGSIPGLCAKHGCHAPQTRRCAGVFDSSPCSCAPMQSAMLRETRGGRRVFPVGVSAAGRARRNRLHVALADSGLPGRFRSDSFRTGSLRPLLIRSALSRSGSIRFCPTACPVSFRPDSPRSVPLQPVSHRSDGMRQARPISARFIPSCPVLTGFVSS